MCAIWQLSAFSVHFSPTNAKHRNWTFYVLLREKGWCLEAF